MRSRILLSISDCILVSHQGEKILKMLFFCGTIRNKFLIALKPVDVASHDVDAIVTKVGKSSYKIDVAVVDDDNKENYCLGIILDGRDYRNLPTVRDREITVPSVLSSLGWNLKRVWVMDWIEKSDTVLSDISETIDKLKGV